MQFETTYKQIWKLSYPLMIGNVALNVMNIVNTAFLGRLDEATLGASAIGGVLYLAMVMIASGLGIGAQIIIARKEGEENESQIGKIVDHTFVLMAVMGTSFFVLLKFVSPWLLSTIIQSKDVLKLSNEYLSYRSYGIFFSLFNAAFRAYFTGVGKTNTVTKGVILMCSVNVLLDYCLILGKWGFDPMGIAGAGLSSNISEICGLLFFCFYLIFKKAAPGHKFFTTKKPQILLIRQIVVLSLPMMLQFMLSLGAWFLFFVLIEKMGPHNLAISNILRSVFMFLMTPIWGYSTATTSLVSNIIGQDLKDQVMSTIHKVIHISMISAAVMVVLSLAFPEKILGIFTNDSSIIHDAIKPLLVISASLLLFSVAAIYLSALSGTGDTKISLVIEVFTIGLYLIYLLLVTSRPDNSLSWVWAAEFLYWTLLGSLSFLWLRTGRWKRISL